MSIKFRTITKEQRIARGDIRVKTTNSIRSELPGLALAHHTFDGFGKELFLPVDEEPGDDFKKEFEIEEPDNGSDGSDDK